LLSRALRVFEEHGDMFGMCSVLVNRCTLSLLTDNIDRLLADYERTLQLAREFGISLIETLCVRDLGEVYLILGQPAQAEPYIRRALETYTQTMGAASARVVNCEVQLARLKWYGGEEEVAGEIVGRVLAQQAEAQATGQSDSLLTASERLALDQVGLALRHAVATEFDALIARGRELALQAQDIVELMEWKALAALRAGRRAEGIALLRDTLAEAERSARLTLDRLRRQLTLAGEPVAPPLVGPAPTVGGVHEASAPGK
jgi:hypothetical protein